MSECEWLFCLSPCVPDLRPVQGVFGSLTVTIGDKHQFFGNWKGKIG